MTNPSLPLLPPMGPSEDAEAIMDFCRDMVLANDEDYADEGYFYTDHPEQYSLARPEILDRKV